MSVFSSLSLWSSIKIFSYPQVSPSKRKFTSVPYVAALNENHRKYEEKTYHRKQEVVQLKIPEMSEKKKSSSGIANGYLEAQTEENTLNNKMSHFSLTNLSQCCDNCFDCNEELDYFWEGENLDEVAPISTTDLVDARKKFENEFGDWDPDFENSLSALYDIEFEETEMGNRDGANPNWVPSVKPWTVEELMKVNELYNTMEENIKKIELGKEKNRKKKKHTLNKKENDFKAPSCYCLNQGDPGQPLCRQSSSVSVDEWCEIFFDCEFSISESDSDAQISALSSAKTEFTEKMAKQSEENYYKSKLAQLYRIANGS